MQDQEPKMTQNTVTNEVVDPSFDERQMSLYVHLATYLNFVVPFSGIVAKILLWKTNLGKSKFFEENAKEAINFEISLFVYSILAVVLVFILIGIPALIILMIFSVVAPIIAGLKAHEKQLYRYPLIFRFIK